MKLQTPLLLFAVFFNALLWMFIVPIWHTPDEQSHFGQVAFMARMGRVALGQENDLTEEIYKSETLLGTQRDKFGNNKFTFHPEYRIEYSSSDVGIYEHYLASLAGKESFVKSEATRYPPLYYAPAAALYRILSGENLLVRVFSVRLWSLILFVINVYLVIKLGKLIFTSQSVYPYILGILVGYQPMMVFSNVGVTSDTLGNTLFTVFLYLCTAIITRGISLSKLLAVASTISISLYVKPQFIVVIPLLVVVLLFYLLRYFRHTNVLKLGCLVFFITCFLIFVLYALRNGPSSMIMHIINNLDLGSLLTFTREYTLSHTIREVLPWYWGVYDWLGVTYPRLVHRVINRILLICLVGFSLWLVRVMRNKILTNRRVLSVWFLMISVIFFYAGIATYDWLLWFVTTYPLAVQGRYLFPTIAAHMVILTIGASTIIPNKFSNRSVLIAVLPFLMIVLNIIALYTVVSTYYDMSSLATLVNQVSQYKPWFSKGPYLIAVFFASIISVVMFVLMPLIRLLTNRSVWDKTVV